MLSPGARSEFFWIITVPCVVGAVLWWLFH